MKIIGIDPGKTGAIAIIHGSTALDLADMPLAGKDLNRALIIATLAEHDDAALAIVEHTQAMPAIPRSTAHSLGMSEGIILGALAALAIPTQSVRASTWKKALAVPADKDEARAAAIRLFPSVADQLSRKKDDGRAEALLLAHYGLRLMLGGVK